MTGIFKANNPYNYFLLFVYGFLLKLPMFLDPAQAVAEQPDGFLYRMVLRWLQPAGDSLLLIYPLITYTLLFVQAVMINKLVNDQRLLQKTTYLPAMVYLLFTSLFSEWNHLSSAIIINTLMIWVITELCKIHNNPKAKSILFNIGILLGIATFFYFPSIAFALLIILGLIVTRPFRLPEWIILFLGVITPYYFMLSWLYLEDRLQEYDVPDVAVTVPVLNETTWSYISIIMIVISVIVGFSFIQFYMRRQLVQTRKSWGLIFFYLIVSLFVPFLNETDNFEYWILTIAPIAIISSAAFLYPERKWFALVFHWGMVALVIISEYFID